MNRLPTVTLRHPRTRREMVVNESDHETRLEAARAGFVRVSESGGDEVLEIHTVLDRSPDDKEALTLAPDGRGMVWDVTQGKVIGTLSHKEMQEILTAKEEREYLPIKEESPLPGTTCLPESTVQEAVLLQDEALESTVNGDADASRVEPAPTSGKKRKLKAESKEG